jgi:ketosteroid isomerase-like protein
MAQGRKLPSTNLDLVRSIYADWERGDYSRTADWGDPEMEWVAVDGPSPNRVVGLKAMAAGWREFLADWVDFRAEAEEYRELDGERVLVFHHFGGRGKSSGLEVGQTTSKGACLFQLVDGKVTKLVLYSVRDRALADLGLVPDDDAGGASR